MTTAEQYKQLAAEAALDLLQPGMRIGLGTGSTANYFVRGLGQRLADGRLHDIAGVPTSVITATLAREVGVPLITLDEYPTLDMAFDGADEIDPQLNLIKGLGAAMLREKIVEAAARRFVVFADSSKLVSQLGTRTFVPVEVIAFGASPAMQRLAALGARVVVRRDAHGEAVRTDEGNLVLDCHFGLIPDPVALATAISLIPATVEHGLFIGMAESAIVAGASGIQVIYPQPRS